MGVRGEMRRTARCLLVLACLGVPLLANAQESSLAVLRTSAGDLRITALQSEEETWFPLDEVMSSVGGTVERVETGVYKVTLAGHEALLGLDSRFAILGEDLIEMPKLPIVSEGRPFVNWQLFQGLLRAAGLDASWDRTTRVLAVQSLFQSALGVQVSVVDLGGLSKIVVELSQEVDLGISRTDTSYVIRFRSPLQPPFAEREFSDPRVRRITMTATTLEVHLTKPGIVASSYKLNQPFRVILDLRDGEAPAEGVTEPQPRPGIRRPDVPGVRTIVLDPGHGGKEVGAEGPGGLLEKDLTLAICRKLRAELVRRYSVRVILTRDDDSLLSLDQRTAIANQYQADLFLSVHLNSAKYPGAVGSETYFLSLDASDERASLVAERENSEAEPVAAAPESDLDLILWDLAQQDYLKESSRFAEFIQEEMAVATGIEKRGVKQAPFRVLIGAAMPAALVEVGFISNAEEEAKLGSEEHQSVIALALANAIGRYKNEYETRLGRLAAPDQVAPPAEGSVDDRLASVPAGRTRR